MATISAFRLTLLIAAAASAVKGVGAGGLVSEPEASLLFAALDRNGDLRLDSSEFDSRCVASGATESELAGGSVTFSAFSSTLPRRMRGALVSGTKPVQVHTSLRDNSGDLVVMWVTGEATHTSTAEFTTAAGDVAPLGGNANGTTHTYTAGGWKGVIHEVHFPPLPLGSVVQYRVGDSTGGWSDRFSVKLPPAPASDAGTDVFGVFGDMGTAIPWGFKVCEQMEADHQSVPFSSIMHIGDIAYGSVALAADGVEGGCSDPGDGCGEIEAIWDLWAQQVQPLAANITYFTGVGNHEKFYNYSSYLARFRNPAPWGGVGHDVKDAIFWFSLDYGKVHWVFMSTEHDYSVGSPQYNWLAADLQKANSNRDSVPWIVFTGHRPMYSSDHSEWDSHRPGAPLQTLIEPLLLRNKVDVYACGHMHMYERVHPVNNGSVVQAGNVYHQPAAPVHVVQGNAGVFEDIEFVTPVPAWSARRAGKIGYGRMLVYNRTHLFYESLATVDGSRIDSFWIVK